MCILVAEGYSNSGRSMTGSRMPALSGRATGSNLVSNAAALRADNLTVEELLMYGDLCQVTYLNFSEEPVVHKGGSLPGRPVHWKEEPNKMLTEYLPNNARGYKILNNDAEIFYLTATSGFFGSVWDPFKLWPRLRRWLKTFKSNNSSDDVNWIGYVACSDNKPSDGSRSGRWRDIVVAWRGTQAISEWASDASWGMQVWGPREKDVVGHFDKSGAFLADTQGASDKGFARIFRDADYTPGDTLSVQGQVQLAVRKLLQQFPGEVASITCTGHSLGGALASLSAFDLWVSGANRDGDKPAEEGAFPIPIRAVTFEAPRVGDWLYARAFDSKPHQVASQHKQGTMGDNNLSMRRVVNRRDMVPQLPISGWPLLVGFMVNVAGGLAWGLTKGDVKQADALENTGRWSWWKTKLFVHGGCKDQVDTYDPKSIPPWDYITLLGALHDLQIVLAALKHQKIDAGPAATPTGAHSRAKDA